ncbi:RDD family protein [Brevibacterium album]|uniref:RDD family protein n=1 Tax=Brevibacterium album TaxID=417948 RepID=UPI00048D705E|nr:RDD family protein [Brevibacterium album]
MSVLVTGEAVALRVQPAHYAARALSALIDYIAYLIVYIALFASAAWTLGALGAQFDLLMNSALILLTVFTTVAIPCAVEAFSHGRSLGKLALGLRVVRDDGGAIGFRHALIRALLWQFEVLATGGGVAALAGLLSPRCKRLGDMLAGTLAVSERARAPRPEQIVLAPHLHAWIPQADVSPIPAGLHYRIVQFLTTASQRTPDSRRERAIELAEELNPYVAPAPPPGTTPEMFLSAVIARSRWEYGERQRRTEAVAGRFRERVGTLPHGLHLS